MIFALAACTSAPGQKASGGEGDGDWSYAKGPHGENCLFYKYGKVNSNGDYSESVTMSCDRVTP